MAGEPSNRSGASVLSYEPSPHIPAPVFTSKEFWDPDRIGALVMYCSDGRWGEAFDDFCHRRLHIPRYDRWAVPGGPAWLVGGEDERDYQQASREQLDLLVRVHKLNRLVLVTHYGCAFYGERLQRGPDGCLSTQLREVRAAATVLRSWYSDLVVESYLAMRRGILLSFHAVE
jgi:carbonic anhydrase-like protein